MGHPYAHESVRMESLKPDLIEVGIITMPLEEFIDLPYGDHVVRWISWLWLIGTAQISPIFEELTGHDAT